MAIVKGVEIADLHFGHKNTELMYSELTQFKEYLENNEVHILNINGDYFDRKLSGSEPAMFYAVTFFSELVEICIRKNIKLRIILGTRSHDLNQVKTMFNHYLLKEGLDMRYIETITEEDILGLKVLYIPEEYVDDPDTYYGEYKKKSYNMIHGHGTWDFVAHNSQIENNSENTGGLRAPVFIWKEWKDAVKDGFIIFGHIHGRNVYTKKIFYPGSFTRWGFGERSAKGFIAYDYNTETKEYNVNIIDNKLAPTYEVISVRELFKDTDIKELKVESIKTVLDNEIAKYDNIRIDLSGLEDAHIQLLKKVFSESPNVKVEVRDRKTLLKEEKTEPAIYEKYSYILKRELPMEETIKRYIEEDLKVKLSLETIKKLISEEAV